MNFFKRVGIIIYMAVMLSSGAFFLLIFFNSMFPSDQWGNVLDFLYSDMKAQTVIGCLGAIFIFIGIISPYKMDKKLKKKRVVTFQNPDGEVSVALSAIEEYIYKIAKAVYGIKDVRSNVNVDKKGIGIVTAISISPRANIPEVTEKIQMEIRNKLQGMLGVEENIDIKIHITKIAKGAVVDGGHEEEPQESGNIPYREIDQISRGGME